jgi:cysteine desulfurase
MTPCYLDHNATTPLRPEARAAVQEAIEIAWGNPSSGHAVGRAARALLERSRERVAQGVGVDTDRVVFTSGATEAISTALHAAGPGRVLVSAVEHPAVRAALLGLSGRDVETIPVGRDGRVDPSDVLARVDGGEKPVLVAVMAAQNETGVIQPVEAIASGLASRGVPLMVDAVQLVGRARVSFEAHYLILTGHKLGGPKGAGALVLGPRARFEPLIRGGGQENGRRGGTEALPAIAGLGAAVAKVGVSGEEEAWRLGLLRDRLEAGLLDRLPGATVVGGQSPRIANTTALCLPEGVEAEPVVTGLDRLGICISAGSACHTGSPAPSRVLLAMGLDPVACFRVVRISLGHTTRPEDIEGVLDALPALVRQANGAQ